MVVVIILIFVLGISTTGLTGAAGDFALPINSVTLQEGTDFDFITICPTMDNVYLHVMDECGNEVISDPVQVTINDDTDPDIDCPLNMLVECGDDTSPTATGEATGTDACGTVSISSMDTSVGGCGNTETITRTWTAIDLCGKTSSCVQTITVEDNTNPDLDLPADITIPCGTSVETGITGNATATDICDANPTVTHSDAYAVGTCANELIVTRTWTATDVCGNSTSLDQIITMVDTADPILSAPSDITIECGTSTSPSITGQATASDNCDNGPTVSFGDATITGTCGNETVITRTWTATDACGNSVSMDQIITLEDKTDPVSESAF